MRMLILSDLHVSQRYFSVQEVALNSLIAHLESESQNASYDMVLIAGDLSFSGKKEEYNLLSKHLIAPLRSIPTIQKATFLCCPGNHDLDCDASTPLSWEGLGKRRQTIFFDESDDGMRVRQSRAISFAAFAEFLDANKIQGPLPGKQVSLQETISFGKKRCNIILTNTCFFSDKEADIVEQERIPAPTLSLSKGFRSGASCEL